MFEVGDSSVILRLDCLSFYVFCCFLCLQEKVLTVDSLSRLVSTFTKVFEEGICRSTNLPVGFCQQKKVKFLVDLLEKEKEKIDMDDLLFLTACLTCECVCHYLLRIWLVLKSLA